MGDQSLVVTFVAPLQPRNVLKMTLSQVAFFKIFRIHSSYTVIHIIQSLCLRYIKGSKGGRSIYVIVKAMCPLDHHHNGFLFIYIYI